MRDDHKKFLDELSNTIDTGGNMFRLGKPLMEEFGLSKQEAKKIVVEWMDDLMASITSEKE